MYHKVIAVDFDGTLCESKWPDIGKANSRLIEWLIRQQADGARLVLWSCREGDLLDHAVMWCLNRGLKFDAINDNTKERQELYGDNCRKVSADIYIDDRNAWIIGAGPKPRMDCLGPGRPAIVTMPEKFDLWHKWKWQRENWKIMKAYDRKRREYAAKRQAEKKEEQTVEETKSGAATCGEPTGNPVKEMADRIAAIDEQAKKTFKEATDKPVPYDEQCNHDNSGEAVGSQEWRIFNRGTDLEFAECSWCEHEVEPNVTVRDWYPDVCPICGCRMERRVDAEEVDAR